MALLPLTNEEKERLKRFNLEKSTIFALKKLFLNACTKDPASNEAIKKVTEAFHDLSNISPDSADSIHKENIV